MRAHEASPLTVLRVRHAFRFKGLELPKFNSFEVLKEAAILKTKHVEQKRTLTFQTTKDRSFRFNS